MDSIGNINNQGIRLYREEPDCNERKIGDGYDASRDIVSFTYDTGATPDRIKVSFEMDHLKDDAEKHMDLFLLMRFKDGGEEELPGVRGKTASPWNVAINIKDPRNYEALVPDGSKGSQCIHNVSFDPRTNKVSFEFELELLNGNGWTEGEPIFIQGYTADEKSKLISDAIGCTELDERGYLAGGYGTGESPSESSGRRWEDEIIYWAMTDRFSNGDKSNDFNADPENPNTFHGGDWQGIINKMDTLKNMGFTTLWISPPMQNDKGFFGSDGYHGYWPHDFFKAEENFGTIEKLRELVDKAHEKGMKVVLDFVLNHTGYNNPMGKDPKYHDWFHHSGSTKFIDPWSMEHGSFRGLPDFAQERPEAAEYLKDVGKFWIEKTGADGYRIDAAKHMPKKFLRDFSEEMHEEASGNFATIGEAYFGDPRPLSKYQKKAGMDLLFDTPMVDVIRNAFTTDSKESKTDLLRQAWKSFFLHPYDTVRNLRKFINSGGGHEFSELFKSDALYDNPHHMVTFMDNHDMSRFLTIAGDDAKKKMRLALTFLMTARGVPAIYYGTEDSMGLDPSTYDRADKKWDDDPEMADFISRLTKLRSDSPALRRGRQHELFADDEIYAFMRTHEKEDFALVFNCSDKEQRREIDLGEESGFPFNGKVKDAISGKEYEIKEGILQALLEPKSAIALRRAK